MKITVLQAHAEADSRSSRSFLQQQVLQNQLRQQHPPPLQLDQQQHIQQSHLAQQPISQHLQCPQQQQFPSAVSDESSVNFSADSLQQPQESHQIYWANPADLRTLLASSSHTQACHTNDLTLQDLSYDLDTRSSACLLESESVYLPFDIPASPVVLRHNFSKSSQPMVRSTSEAAKIQNSILHPQQTSSNLIERKFGSQPQPQFDNSLNEQLIGSVQRPNFMVSRPVTSSSEPSVRSVKEKTLQTARSEDYESSNEQTTAESDNAEVDTVRSPRTQQFVVHAADSKSRVAPQDKLSHIKTVAGSRRVSNKSDREVKVKVRTAARNRGGPNLIMKTLFTPSSAGHSATTTSSAMAARDSYGSANQSYVSNASSTSLDSNQSKTNIPILNTSVLAKRLDKVGQAGGDKKLLKGKLNQLAMNYQTKNVSSAKANKAATVIQARWRGYWTRHHNSQVVSVRNEIRARRAEDHIILLRQDLERNRRLYDEEKQLRILQMEAIKLLYKEVQELKNQRTLTNSKDLIAAEFSRPSTADMNSRLSPMVSPAAGTTGSTGFSELNRTEELERTCASLQNQVSQLQEALESVSCAVFKGNSLESASFDIADNSEKVVITPFSESRFRKVSASDEASQWGCIPHSLSPYPSEEEDSYYHQVPSKGAPTPPRHLQLKHYNHQALLLSWQPSLSSQSKEEEANKHIIGYRVYMNDQLKAFVCQRTAVLVEGLNSSTTYKFYVKALSGLGESYESNIVMAKLARCQERQAPPANSGTESSQDSDKDVDSLEQNRSTTRKMHRSPKASEKKRGMGLHYKRGQESGQDTNRISNINFNNSATDGSTFSVLTYPKLLSQQNRDHCREESRDFHSVPTSQESSPSPGITVTTGESKIEEISVNVNLSQLLSSRGLSPRRLLDFSKPNPQREHDFSNEGRSNVSVSTHEHGTKDRDGWRVQGSPPGGSMKGSPTNSKKRDETAESEGNKQSPGSDKTPCDASSTDRNASQAGNFSETFTVDKAHSYLESVNAITQAVLLDRSLTKHKWLFSHPQGGKISTSSGGRMISSEQEQHPAEVKALNIPLLSQPIIDGRRRHSSGSRPNSPVVIAASGEKTRMTVAEAMMEQKLRSLNKSTSLNSLVGHSEDGSLKSESNKQSPSIESISNSSQGDTLHGIISGDSCILEESLKEDISKRTNSNESLVSSFTDTSKRSHSNESLTGAAKHSSSRRSASNESLSESVPEELDGHSVKRTHKMSADQSSPLENVASGCKRSQSVGSAKDLVQKVKGDSQTTKTSSVLTKLLIELEKSISRRGSSTSREGTESAGQSRGGSTDQDLDMTGSKPPSDDERKSHPRSRNLSDSDAEGRASDPGSQLPPRAPSDGSHSDDSRPTRKSHRRTPSDQQLHSNTRPTHSPIIMEVKKSSASMRRNQSFHGLLPSKHQDTKSPSLPHEDNVSKPEETASYSPVTETCSSPSSHLRSRTPSPSRGRKPVLSGAQLKNLPEALR